MNDVIGVCGYIIRDEHQDFSVKMKSLILVA
jgi:hypothetical protein